MNAKIGTPKIAGLILAVKSAFSYGIRLFSQGNLGTQEKRTCSADNFFFGQAGGQSIFKKEGSSSGQEKRTSLPDNLVLEQAGGQSIFKKEGASSGQEKRTSLPDNLFFGHDVLAKRLAGRLEKCISPLVGGWASPKSASLLWDFLQTLPGTCRTNVSQTDLQRHGQSLRTDWRTVFFSQPFDLYHSVFHKMIP